MRLCNIEKNYVYISEVIYSRCFSSTSPLHYIRRTAVKKNKVILRKTALEEKMREKMSGIESIRSNYFKMERNSLRCISACLLNKFSNSSKQKIKQ